jgi:transcriptional regulator with XRE-family HTH domain
MKQKKDEIFANNIRKIRLGYGLSQEEFADILQVSRAAYAKWEEQKSKPRVKVLVLISQMCNVRIEDLLCREIDKEYKYTFRLIQYLADKQVKGLAKD